MANRISWPLGAVLSLLFASSNVCAAPPQKLGPEFLVNQANTSGKQDEPSVDGLADGGFMVTWRDKSPSISYVARRYNAAGLPQGDLLLSGDEAAFERSQAAGLAGGGFAFTWPCDDGFRFRAYNNVGRSFEPRHCLSSSDGSNNYSATIKGLRNGSFVIAFEYKGFDSELDGHGVIVETYSVVGSRRSSSTLTFGFEGYPRVAGLTNGRFVVTFMAGDGRRNGYGIFGQLYSGAGARIGSNFRINSTLTGNQALQDVGTLPDGGFVVVWQSLGQDGSLNGIYGQRYNANGARVGGEFRINVTTASDQNEPSAAGLSGGGFVVTWTSAGNQDGSGKGVFGRLYNAAGVPLAGEFRVNTYTFSTQSDSSVAALPNNQFVVVWSSYGQDGDKLGVYGQRFRVP